MAGAALVPFGKEVVRINDLVTLPPGAIAVPEDRADTSSDLTRT